MRSRAPTCCGSARSCGRSSRVPRATTGCSPCSSRRRGAEAYLELGALDTAAECLDAAQGAIVGLPFLEIDWRIECLRAEVARRRGEREEARLHLHRALHTRDLIARSLPARLRRTFLAHRRFARLAGLEKALRAPSPTPVTAPEIGDPGGLGIVAISQRMRVLVETILRLRDQDLPVLITGETGTGKELVARAIYRSSPRVAAPFLTLHAASLPAELFESELFGHEVGAFTGADEARPGLLEHVHGGTLFLDEVASLPLASQARLLRVVESGVVRRLGGLEPCRVDVRFIASTCEDLEKLIAEGAFRRDLYHRLAVVRIHVPPLRERSGDIRELARRLLEVHARRFKLSSSPPLTDASLELFEAHDWPGNVRELESVLVRLILAGTARGDQAAAIAALLPAARERALFDEGAIAGRKIHDLHRELDRVYLSRLFRDSNGDFDAMAGALGIKVSNLYHWLKRVGLDIRGLRRGQ
jgi:DNA-binding NtrC family response regulator